MSVAQLAERGATYDLQGAADSALGQAFDLLATAPQGVVKLREFILSLAVQGVLCAQDARDEPSSTLLKQIEIQREALITSGTLKRGNPLAPIRNDEAPFEIPSNWSWARLGQITNFGSADKAGKISEDTWVLDLEDIEKNSSRLLCRVTFSERQSLSAKNLFRAGDVLYGKLRPYLNKVIVADQDGVCTTEILPLRCFGPYEPDYLRIALQSPYFLDYVNGKSYGMKMPRLGTEDGRRAVIPLPPLAEQGRIVARVEELMQLCDALEAHGRLQDEQHARLVATLFDTLAASESAHALAENWQRIATHFDVLLDRPEAVDTLEQTLLQLAVRGLLVQQDPADEPATRLLARIRAEEHRLDCAGEIKRKRSSALTENDQLPFELPPNWAWVAFDDIVRPDKPIAYGVLVPGPDLVDGVPFVRLADISLTNPPEKPAKSIAPDVDAQFERTRLEGGEILIGVVGSIGKLGIAPMSWRGANIARAICRIAPTHLVDRQFVIQLLQSEFMQSRFKGDTRTLAQPTLNVGLIRNCPAPLPPLAEQHRIVARVEQLRQLCADLSERLQQARATQSQLADALVSAAAQPPSC